ncbi:MAG TPA: DUF5666 domain-containing protein [Thermoanaerobaculia bacterium]|nr:DUF5666 domain-containing protein [Thermoanaerobaculia bacterium]
MKKRAWIAVMIISVLFAVACRHDEMPTSSYGAAVVTGQVAMADGGTPEGIVVTVSGTGMSVVLDASGQFAFNGVPESAELRLVRSSDGIDASYSTSGSRSMTIELSGRTPSSGAGRRRSTRPLLQYEGIIRSASATSLVIFTSHQEEVTVTLTADTVIRKGRETIAAADLKAEQRVHVKASVADDVKTAVEVIVQQLEGEEGGERGEQVATANGIVKSVAAASLVVLRANGEEVTVEVTDQTRITQRGRTMTFADIKAGDRVEARGVLVNPQTIRAVQIQVQAAR